MRSVDMGCILGVNAGCTKNVRRPLQLDILIRMVCFWSVGAAKASCMIEKAQVHV